jgi:hypothetical protein
MPRKLSVWAVKLTEVMPANQVRTVTMLVGIDGEGDAGFQKALDLGRKVFPVMAPAEPVKEGERAPPRATPEVAAVSRSGEVWVE